MFSLLSCASGCLALCSSMSWDSRRAQAMPAGPPPTITTSASMTGRSTFGSGVRKTIIATFAISDDARHLLRRGTYTDSGRSKGKPGHNFLTQQSGPSLALKSSEAKERRVWLQHEAQDSSISQQQYENEAQRILEVLAALKCSSLS